LRALRDISEGSYHSSLKAIKLEQNQSSPGIQKITPEAGTVTISLTACQLQLAAGSTRNFDDIYRDFKTS